MKLSRLLRAFTAALLAFISVLGGLGGFSRAFGLNVSYDTLTLWIAAAAILGAGIFSFRRGGTFMVCLLSLLGGFLWRRGDFLRQMIVIAHLVSRVYNSAYGWGTVIFKGDPGISVTLVLCVLGGLSALLFTWSVIRQRWGWLTVLVCLLPLFACLAVTNVVPGTGDLYLQLLGLLLFLLTQRVRRRDWADGTKLTWLLAPPTALALGLLFLLLPRSQYQGQDRAARISDSVISWAAELPAIQLEPDGSISLNLPSEHPTDLNLRSVGPKRQSHRKVMEVTAESSGVLYLRGKDYNVYDGTSWISSALRSESFSVNSEFFALENAGTVTIHTIRSNKLKHFPYYPQEDVTLVGGTALNKQSESAYAWQRMVLPNDWAETAEESWQLMEQYIVFPAHQVASPEADIPRYTMLPEETKQWAAQYLTEHLSLNFNEESADYRQIMTARAIADLVRQSAVYDLDTPRMPRDADDFVRWFLQSSDTGYGVHFASATAVLLRAAGIEARLVEGYLIDVPAGGSVTVTSENAHAWVEYFVPDVGWVVLESTAAATETTPVWAPEVTENARPQQAAPTPTTLPPAPPAKGTPPAEISFILPVMLLCLFPVTLITQWRIRLSVRQKRLISGSPNRQALEKWQYALLLSSLLKQPPPEALEQLALRARFSQHILTAPEMAVFDDFCRSALAQLRQLPLLTRLYHRLIRAAY